MCELPREGDPGGGYRDLKAADAADWATTVGSAWISLMNQDTPVGLIESAVASVANLED